ncbi:MAG: sulfotransferase [Anaerolineales bacterium]|nr:sulfotransferase [Anaerolineales bacterium]
MMEALKVTEELLFKKYEAIDTHHVPLVFILASLRTGSTPFYQLLINAFDFFYFTNFIHTNFTEYPAVGAALNPVLDPGLPVSYESEYGKTKGDFDPSEGSLIFRHWFGGEHPSETHSARVLPGRQEHLIATFKTIYGLTGKTVLTKNAWNVFRIQAWSSLFPQAVFIWLHRDIRLAAFSDLKARYLRGSAHVWNSATPANYLEIQRLPYWEQVVEQQYAYNRVIERDLTRFCKGRYLEMWYEDVFSKTDASLTQLQTFFKSACFDVRMKSTAQIRLQPSRGEIPNEDFKKIVGYVGENHERFASFIKSQAMI